MLDGWLDHHRDTLALKCAGLTDEQLRMRAVTPSGLSLLGLVRHLTECERGWFRETMGGAPISPYYCGDDDPEGDFHPGDDDTWADAYARWQAEVAVSREVAARYAPDDHGEGRRVPVTGEPYTLRWVLTHMIEEYARHNGHADLIREALDGTTGD
jgi:uncharacterized damage-inducible protein DinB